MVDRGHWIHDTEAGCGGWGLWAIGIVAVVLLRAVDGGDMPSGPATDPEPTLWMESEFG